MPKPNYVLSDYLKKELYKLVCIRLGFPIRSKLDCRKLSEQITTEGHSSISESSLYRLFLHHGSSNRPYLHTLDILARFCGFNGWNDFEEQQNKLDSFVRGYGLFPQNRTSLKSLISVCIHTDEIKPLIHYTEQFNDITDVDLKVKFAEEIFQSTLTNSDNRLFFRQFCRFPVIREYYFEFLADPSFSIPNYEEGIHCYLSGLRKDERLRDLQDYVFGNCLLFRHYFISGQLNKAGSIGKELYERMNLNENQLTEIGVFPTARYFSCKIIYFELKKDKKRMTELIEELFDYLERKMVGQTREEQRIFFFSLGECFILSTLIDLQIHDRLKVMFSHLFDVMPSKLYDQKLDKIIPYFNQNGSLYHLLNNSNLN
ncbi:MAG: hypothetical protein RL632_1660 [Bacteroidota bacterium]|jgi:hypothetical protein